MCACTSVWEGFPRSAGGGLERLLPTPSSTVLQGLMWGSYLERKRILHSVFINVKWQGKLLRDSSSSDPHFLLRGHPWDTAGKQGSHFLISCYTQQTRLKCSISCCSLPAATEGKNNPSPTNRYNHSHLCAPAVSLSRRGPGREGRRAGLDANTSILLGCAPCICAKP